MLDHIGVADVVENGQVNGVRQEQFVEIGEDFVDHVQRQIRAAAQSQVNVGAVLVVAFGARAVQNCPFHLRVAAENGADFLDGGLRETVFHAPSFSVFHLGLYQAM